VRSDLQITDSVCSLSKRNSKHPYVNMTACMVVVFYFIIECCLGGSQLQEITQKDQDCFSFSINANKK